MGENSLASIERGAAALDRLVVDVDERKLIAVDLHDFLARELPPRESIFGSWLTTQSLSMIYAWRGVGKTHVALGIAYAVTSGGSFLKWEAPKPRGVLYLDGEMPGPALQERLAAILSVNANQPERGAFKIITPDLQSGAMPDLATKEGQAAVSAVIDDDTALIIVDNLSTLVRSGGRENDAESWLSVASWALSMRAAGRAVLFIHHANKNGAQRGTSKKEDVLDNVVVLKRPSDTDPTDGAVFELHFEKARGLFGDEVAAFEAKLSTDSQGRQSWTMRSLENADLDRVVELVQEGAAVKDIAEETGLSRFQVNRIMQKAKASGLIDRVEHKRGGYRMKKDGDKWSGLDDD